MEINIEKILRSRNICKAAGIDDLSGHFLKDGSQALSKPISEMCNLSIKLGSFPDSCQIPKLKLLFKKGSKTNPSNYRPILLLTLISEMIEKLIHEQTSTLLSNNEILYSQNFGKTTWQTHASCFYMTKFWRVLMRAWWLAWYWLTSTRHLIWLTMIYDWKNWVLLVSQIILLVGSNHTFQINCFV